MNTLRVKIALLMVVVIVSVVFSLTLVLFYLLGPPKRVYSLGPVAKQVVMLLRAAEEGSNAVPVVAEPELGRVHDGSPRNCARRWRRAASTSRSRWRAMAGGRR